MEAQQMMELLLVRMNTNTKASQEDLLARMDANTKAKKEMTNEMRDKIKEYMNTNIKANRDNLKEMMEEIMNANQAKTNADLKEMREEIISVQAEIRCTVNAWIADMKKDQKGTM
jgi:G:T/U-mismatch repair DNA glycosylase